MSLCDLYYVHVKSFQKHRELKNLFNVLEGQFEMYNAGVHPMKSTSMCWIHDKICIRGCVDEKFCLYNQHLENVISTTANSKGRATLEGKYAKLVDVKVCVVLFSLKF